MTDYKPGTVAIATVRGVPNVRVMRYEFDGDFGWCSAVQVERETDHSAEGDVVTDIRPLVVLDLNEAYGCWAMDKRDPAVIVAQLRETNSVAALALADQIEEQTKPPRIPEPGLWGVIRDKFGTYWIKADDSHAPWKFDGGAVDWDSLVDPTLIREGVDQ